MTVSDLYARYAELLLAWNRRINLTAARTRDQIDDHIADSRALLPHIGAPQNEAIRVLDVGAGAGFPGIVLAIARPDLHVTLLEPTRKKHAFLATCVRQLALAHATALPERLEDHAGRDYDVAVSRATWPVPEWLTRAAPYVRPGGLILAMEGKEQHPLPPGATRHPYTLASRTRAIVAAPVD